MRETLYLHQISLGIGVAGVLVILWGVTTGLVQLIRAESASLRGHDALPQKEALRRHLGYYFLLGLEFLIAADIVETILKPSLLELAGLGAIVAIRTVISFSLNWELSRAGERRGATE